MTTAATDVIATAQALVTDDKGSLAMDDSTPDRLRSRPGQQTAPRHSFRSQKGGEVGCHVI